MQRRTVITNALLGAFALVACGPKAARKYPLHGHQSHLKLKDGTSWHAPRLTKDAIAALNALTTVEEQKAFLAAWALPRHSAHL